jgi:hypothetical protein
VQQNDGAGPQAALDSPDDLPRISESCIKTTDRPADDFQP